MEGSTVVKGLFFDTKRLDSELMVRCLHAVLNNLPDFEFTSINRDEKFLGYRVHFCRPDEEAVLEKLQLKVFGRDIRICPLMTCLAIRNVNSGEKILLEREIKDAFAVDDRFGKVLDISPVPESPTYRNENVHLFRVLSDIPEIKAQEMFQKSESGDILLTIPNKNSKLKVTLYCTLCKKEGHVARDCNQEKVAPGRKISDDGERVFADSTMKMDISFEPTEAYAEKIGREEIMKTGYLSVGEMPEEKYTPEKKEFKKEPKLHSSAGVSGENLTAGSNNNSYLPSDEDDDVQLLSHHVYAQDEYPFNFQAKTEPGSTEEESNACPPESPGPSVRKRRCQRPPTAVEDMNVLSESLQKYISNICENSGIITRKDLQAFFHHVKKKSNVLEVALKYVANPSKVKGLLQNISKFYYSTTQTGTKEDKRFIKWLDERIQKFDKKVPQKRKRTGPNQDDAPARKVAGNTEISNDFYRGFTV